MYIFACRHSLLGLYVVLEVSAAERSSLAIVAEPVINLRRNAGKYDILLDANPIHTVGPGNPVL